jgi:hypothetical protein
MHSAIEACFREIDRSIPIEILQRAFPLLPGQSLDDAIHTEVIGAHVLPDCNLMGGRKKDIVLDSRWIELAETPEPFVYGNTQSYTLYRIPAEAREFRPISKVIGVRYPYALNDGLQTPTYGLSLAGAGTTMDGLSSQILNSHTFGNKMVLPTPILKSGDIVQLTPNNVSHIQNVWVLECRLYYDEEFTNLNEQAIMTLMHLVRTAVEMYIYNKLIIKTDMAFLSGGQQLGKMKEIIESYSDRRELYFQLLKQFNGAAIILDPEKRRARIRDAL